MKIYPKMDWLTLTAPYDLFGLNAPIDERQADVVMSRILRAHTPIEATGVLPIKRNEPHYHFHYSFSEGWQLSLSARQFQGVRIVASGGILPVGQSEQRYVYEEFRRYGWRVTRLDVAVDVMDSGSSIESQWFDGLAEQSFRRRFKTDLILNPNGDTIAVGSRKSDKYLRLYDKGKEQKTNLDWLRYEIEIKYKVARALPDNYNDCIRGAVASMRGMLDYIPDTIERGISAIAQDAEAFKNPTPRTRGNRELWLMEQIIPALVRTKRENPEIFHRFISNLLDAVK